MRTLLHGTRPVSNRRAVLVLAVAAFKPVPPASIRLLTLCRSRGELLATGSDVAGQPRSASAAPARRHARGTTALRRARSISCSSCGLARAGVQRRCLSDGQALVRCVCARARASLRSEHALMPVALRFACSSLPLCPGASAVSKALEFMCSRRYVTPLTAAGVC